MVERSYKLMYQIATGDGFSAFAKEWLRAKAERTKWTKAARHHRKGYMAKAHAIWVSCWHEDKKNRHLIRYMMRGTRRNRLTRAMGIWQHMWMINHQDRATTRSADMKRAMKIKAHHFGEMVRHVAHMKRLRWAVCTMTGRMDKRTKHKILNAWKFLVDFSFIQEHKLFSHEVRKARIYMKDGFTRWCVEVGYAKRVRGLVMRTHRYHAKRRLAKAMDDWEFEVSICRKEKILEQANSYENPLEVVDTMQAYIHSVVRKDRVRPYELQAVASFLSRCSDIKLDLAITGVNDVLVNKIDKPTAEEIARRMRLPPSSAPKSEAGALQSSSQENKDPSAGAKPKAPTVVSERYTDTLAALNEAKSKETESKKRLEEKRQMAMDRASEPVMSVPQVVYPPLGDAYFPQVAVVEAEKTMAMQRAEAEAKIDAEVDAAMSGAMPAGMPVSSTRKLLEKQYRREMKMKMSRDLQMGGFVPPEPAHPMDMDAAVLHAAEMTSRIVAEGNAAQALEHHRRMQMGLAAGAVPPEEADLYYAAMASGHMPGPPGSPPLPGPPLLPGSPGGLAAARQASLALQKELEEESQSAR